jgi:hypothetical protein
MRYSSVLTHIGIQNVINFMIAFCIRLLLTHSAISKTSLSTLPTMWGLWTVYLRHRFLLWLLQGNS